MNKDFEGWSKLKPSLHTKERIATFKQSEIWWCSIGVNIGHEEDGKNQLHHRPVVIIKKFNKHIFWGLPLTTKIKENPYYKKIVFNNKEQCVMLTQLRLLDGKRLDRKIGELPNNEFMKIINSIQEILPKISQPVTNKS